MRRSDPQGACADGRSDPCVAVTPRGPPQQYLSPSVVPCYSTQQDAQQFHALNYLLNFTANLYYCSCWQSLLFLNTHPFFLSFAENPFFCSESPFSSKIPFFSIPLEVLIFVARNPFFSLEIPIPLEALFFFAGFGFSCSEILLPPRPTFKS